MFSRHYTNKNFDIDTGVYYIQPFLMFFDENIRTKHTVKDVKIGNIYYPRISLRQRLNVAYQYSVLIDYVEGTFENRERDNRAMEYS